MNEQEVGRLMERYRDELGTCSKVPKRVRRPLALRGATLLVGAAGVAAIALMLAPRDASASAMLRMEKAIQNATSMEVVTTSDMNGKRSTVIQRRFYQDGNWRSDVWVGQPTEATRVKRDGQALMSYRRLPYATLQPIGADEETDDSSPVQFAKDITDFGRTPEGRTMHTTDGPNGTYRILMERASDNYKAEILVDEATDLPIWATFQYMHDDLLRRFRHEFRFNQKLDPKLFALEAGKPIVVLAEAQAELGEQWKKGLGKVCGAVVRDASVTPDGTVWIAVGAQTEGHEDLPRVLTADNGAEYVRTGDMVPSAIKAAKPARIGGERISMIGFVPLDERAPLATRVELTLEHDNKPAGTVDLTLRREPWIVPGYFAALDMDYWTLQAPMTVWQERAHGLEVRKRYLAAAQAYERCAFEYRNWVRYVGYRPLKLAAYCYEKAGMMEKAKEAREESRALLESRAR